MYRAESPMMRTLRQLDYDRQRLCTADVIAMVVGYTAIGSALCLAVLFAVDALQGQPMSVTERLQALLAWLEAQG